MLRRSWWQRRLPSAVKATAKVEVSRAPHGPLPEEKSALSRAGKKINDFGYPEVALINDAIRKGWADHNLAPSKAATDGEWCRRVYLDLIGRIPTVKELDEYVSDKKRDKRATLVDKLLGDEYNDEYVRNWTTLWANILIGRTGGTGRRDLADRDGMKQYLGEVLKYNKSYDELAKELITATGSCLPGDDDFNGAANFLVDKMAENGVQATARTSQIFLGMAVQCTQCHNHPFNEQKQNQFWEMNAFFRQTEVERVRVGDNRRDDYGRVVNEDFRGEGGNKDKAETVLRAAQRQAEGGVPGVCGWNVAGRDCLRRRARILATAAR